MRKEQAYIFKHSVQVSPTEKLTFEKRLEVDE